MEMVPRFRSYTLIPNSSRPLQREVIVAALDGHDVFVQAATSFGKSLCFQLPAVIDHGSMWWFILYEVEAGLTFR